MIRNNFKKRFVFCAIAAIFAATQIAQADGLANASINSTQGGFVGMENGVNSATLNFNGNSHVNWNTLNVNSNETLNFNAVDGASGLTILNTVSGPVSHIFGTINSNPGISKLIISNPNGLMFDGSSFNAAGDVMLTTQKLAPQMNASSGNMDGVLGVNQVATQAVYTRNNASFNIGGTFNIVGPKIFLTRSNINAPRLRLTTQNGQDFLVNNYSESGSSGTLMRAVSVNGNVLIISGEDDVAVNTGTNINGGLSVYSEGNVKINDNKTSPRMNINGHLLVNVNGNNGKKSDIKVRNVNAKEFIDLDNSKGDVIVRDVNIEDAIPYEGSSINAGNGYNSSRENIILLGNNSFDKDLSLNASGNVIVGNYGNVQDAPASGGLNVSDGLYIKTFNGNVLFKDNVNANLINVDSAKNILTAASDSSVNGETAMLNANTYGLFANGYIGAVEDSNSIPGIMNSQLPISTSIRGYMNVGGGTLVGRNTTGGMPEVRIKSHDDLTVSSFNAGNMYLTAVSDSNPLGSDITINPNVSANKIVIGEETKDLYVPYDARNYNLQFTNIRDGLVTDIGGSQAITYEDFNAPGGFNDGVQTEINTRVDAPSAPNRAQLPSANNNIVSALKTLPLMTKKKQ